jgi:hypothetical protein
MPNLRLNLRIALCCVGFVVPSACLAQQFSTYPASTSSSSGLSIRKAAYRSIAPKRFTAPLFAVPLLPLHRSPADNLFVNEILLGDGSIADLATIRETASNLVATGLFSHVETRLDTLRDKEHPKLSPIETDISLSLFERPSAAPFLIMETGGGTATSGLGMSFSNVDGKGGLLETSLVYRSENAIGWQGEVRLHWRMQETNDAIPMTLEARILGNRFRNAQEFSILSPASEKQQYNEWSVNLSHHGGMEFRYIPSERSSILEPAAFVMQTFESWRFNSTGIVRGSYWDTDFYLSGTVQVDWSQRENTQFTARSFDNTVLGLAEIGTEHKDAVLLDEQRWAKELHIIGKSLSSAVLVGFYAQAGLIGGIRINDANIPWQTYVFGAGRSVLFLTARVGAAAMLGNNVYLSLRGEVCSESIARGEAKLSAALGNGIILTSRFLVDVPNGGYGFFTSDYSVRGYGANTIVPEYAGLLWNVELRGFPLADFGAYRLSGTLFFDTISLQRFDNNNSWGGSSLGAGLRLKYPALLSSNGTEGVLRLDLAFVPELGRFGQVIISTREAFMLFDDFPARQQRLIATQRFVE